MTNDLEDVVSLGGPGVIEDSGSTGGIVHFLSVEENLSLSRSHGPDDDDFVFLSAAVRSSETLVQGILIRISKAPVGREECVRPRRERERESKGEGVCRVVGESRNALLQH